jgi:hypothetical protein
MLSNHHDLETACLAYQSRTLGTMTVSSKHTIKAVVIAVNVQRLLLLDGRRVHPLTLARLLAPTDGGRWRSAGTNVWAGRAPSSTFGLLELSFVNRFIIVAVRRILSCGLATSATTAIG